MKNFNFSMFKIDDLGLSQASTKIEVVFDYHSCMRTQMKDFSISIGILCMFSSQNEQTDQFCPKIQHQNIIPLYSSESLFYPQPIGKLKIPTHLSHIISN